MTQEKYYVCVDHTRQQVYVSPVLNSQAYDGWGAYHRGGETGADIQAEKLAEKLDYTLLKTLPKNFEHDELMKFENDKIYISNYNDRGLEVYTDQAGDLYIQIPGPHKANIRITREKDKLLVMGTAAITEVLFK